MILKHKFDKQFESQLSNLGVSWTHLLHRNDVLDIEDSLETIKPDVARLILKPISATKQFKVVEHLLESAEKSKGVYCISSFPSDERACQLAVSIISEAFRRTQKKKQAKPLWHRVFGGYKDELRDKSVDKPSLLILSNIDANNSTGSKLEKVRDILEKFNTIPRIVVLAGGDPHTFFANVLHYPLRAGVMLGPPNRVKEI
jgi:hypothetical protein